MTFFSNYEVSRAIRYLQKVRHCREGLVWVREWQQEALGELVTLLFRMVEVLTSFE